MGFEREELNLGSRDMNDKVQQINAAMTPRSVLGGDSGLTCFSP